MTDARGADTAGAAQPGSTSPARAGGGRETDTARALATRTGFAAFRNHLVVDALLALFPFGSTEFVRLRDRYRPGAFHAAAAARRSCICTFAPSRRSRRTSRPAPPRR